MLVRVSSHPTRWGLVPMRTEGTAGQYNTDLFATRVGHVEFVNNYAEPDKKREFLDGQVRFETLAAEAIARGYDKDPEVVEAVKKIVVQKITREEFDKRVRIADVTDADLQTYFDGHKADYDKPEMVRSSVIVVGFGADKVAAKKNAQEAQKRGAEAAKLEDRAFFKDLVVQYSTDESTKRAGGDLRYLEATEFEKTYGADARTWLYGPGADNAVSPLIESKEGFLVFKRTGRKAAITRTFDQVKNQIKNVVYREKRTAAFDAFVEELKTKHGVQVYADKLDKLKVNGPLPAQGDPHAGIPGFPGGGGMGAPPGMGAPRGALGGDDDDDGGANAPEAPAKP